MTLTLSLKKPPVTMQPPVTLLPGTTHLPGFCLADSDAILAELPLITRESPFRHMKAMDGTKLTVALTNCGKQGWITDRHGDRFVPNDTQTGRRWPPAPVLWIRRAQEAALEAGFKGFKPDTCLVERYEPCAFTKLHQDNEELDLTHPIVCLSFGLSATCQIGGTQMDEAVLLFTAAHGDAVVYAGPSRLRFRGVLPLEASASNLFGNYRLVLTFRKAA